MIILGIETSCDETAAALVRDGKTILSNVVASQIKLHSKYFGVVPELASRAHLEKINQVINQALIHQPHFDAVAYTQGPGLMGSLLVGQVAASTIAYARNVPVIPINHIEGHILSVLFDNPSLTAPLLALVVSGGHTELVLVTKIGGPYRVLGQTRDDAAGEAFDKVAKLLNIGYPGGPKIEQLSRSGNPDAIKFTRPYMWDCWDFSFSGIKTAVMYHVRDKYNGKPVPKKDVNDLCASFQSAMIDTLVNKTIKCSQKFKLDNIIVVGGVSANMALRAAFKKSVKKAGLHAFFPDLKLSTDNAAMIAGAGYYKIQNELKKNKKFKFEFRLDGCNLKPNPNLPLT
jgi:N6-L-threonylcarbamoyladenine synthase